MPCCPAGHEVTEEEQMAGQCPICDDKAGTDGPCSCGEMYEGRPCAPDCTSWESDDDDEG